MIQNIEEYQTDHLFLLVGTNPLPNYVAAMVLARPRASVYLLHSGGEQGTLGVADKLAFALRRDRPDLGQVVPYETDERDSARIVQSVQAILSDVKGSIGLNYTGGTKPMAIHAYRAIEQEIHDAVFSYLDARTLMLVIDARGSMPPQKVRVGDAVTLSLENLLALHGYKLDPPCQEPRHIRLCRALMEVHSTAKGLEDWRQYLKQNPLQSLPDALRFPSVVQALKDLCEGATPSEELIASKLGFQKLESCRKFLMSEWLEEYTLDALSQAASQLEIKHYGVNLKPRKPGVPSFELDLAAMYGYQLFAISCRATDLKDQAQEHLFEVYARARQLGGDEARYGLVCFYDDRKILRDEIQQSWDPEGKVEVFGRKEVPHLAEHLKDWFVRANKG